MANIFNDFSQVRDNIAANVNNELDVIMPYLDAAVNDILPVLSQAQWDKLVQDFEADSSDQAHLKLLSITRRALVYFAYSRYSNQSVRITDGGLERIENDGFKSTFQYQDIAFIRLCLKEGWRALENLFSLLNNNKNDYTEWVGSVEYTTLKTYVFHYTVDFSLYRRIEGYRTLDALRPAILHVQQEIIRNNISQGLYDEIVQQLIADSLSPANKTLLQYIRKATAFLSLSRGLEELNWRVTAEGLYAELLETNTANVQASIQADSPKVSGIRMEAETRGRAALDELRTFLNNNAGTGNYSQYYNSELFTKNSAPSSFQNTEGGVFVL